MTDNVTLNDSKRDLKFYCHSCRQKLDASALEPFSKIICPVCSAELIVPMWLENYLLEEPVGQGGMATVYRALDIALDREVAIKLLDQITLGPETIDIFLHEARTAATINHNAIIPIYTCGTVGDKAYIVMQYMSGGSLDDQLQEHGAIQPATAARWMCNAAEGLFAAAKRGIVHHDVKPGNIMLDDAGVAKVGDFGIANSVHSAVNELVREKFKDWVTPNYVSPEKVLYQTEDYRGDIYSLGATFFHLLTGQTPFYHEDMHTLAMLRTTTPPPVPMILNPNIPKSLNDLVLAMMHLNPAKRPDYEEVINKLKKYLGAMHAPSMSKRPIRKSRSSVPAKKPGSNVGGLIAVGVLMALAIGGIIFFVLNNDSGRPANATASQPVKPRAASRAPAGPAPIFYAPGTMPDSVTAAYLRQIHTSDYSRSTLRFLNNYSFPEDAETDTRKKRYLDNLPEKERARELRCIEVLAGLKPSLIEMMRLLPYRVSPIIVIAVRDTAINYRGSITASNRYISIPIDSTGERSANYSWSKIDKMQFAAFLRHYADLRRNDGDAADAAADYLKLAVYLDWIGQYQDAADALNMALTTHPEIRSEALKYFLLY